MKQPITFLRGSCEDLQNRLVLRRLKFERAMDRCDYDEANIACAQIAYIEHTLAGSPDPRPFDPDPLQ